MAKMPVQKPGKSEQVVCTPPNFIEAVKEFLHIEQFDCDLAADKDNTVAPKFYDEEMDSLKQTWKCGTGWNWCNPPYANIGPWVAKAYRELVSNDARTVMLVPASVGSNWWADCVHEKAEVVFLNGRITFVGHENPYPKDLALLYYANWQFKGGYSIRPWKPNN